MIAPLDLIRPSQEFSVAAVGRGCPAGRTVRKPNRSCGTTATFSEYACAVAGTPHAPLGIAKSREVPAAMLGPAKGPLGALRVSMTRHRAIG
jgi:hypothetical protein